MLLLLLSAPLGNVGAGTSTGVGPLCGSAVGRYVGASVLFSCGAAVVPSGSTPGKSGNITSPGFVPNPSSVGEYVGLSVGDFVGMPRPVSAFTSTVGDNVNNSGPSPTLISPSKKGEGAGVCA